MWNAPLTGIMAIVFGPIRDFVLDPSFAILGIFLPPLFSNSRVDAVAAKILHGIMFPLRLVYQADETVDLRRNAKNTLIINGKAGIHLPFRPPSDTASAFRGAMAFFISVTADLVGTIMDRKKMMKWFEAMSEFKAYLDMSGVGEELDEAIMKPLKRGRLLDNLKILNDVQEVMYADRAQAINQSSPEDLKDPLLEGKRFMRFATAGKYVYVILNLQKILAHYFLLVLSILSAYGTEMIRSAIDREAEYHHLETQTNAIAFHCGIQAQDIRILYVEDGGSMKVLRHFVAVDRETKSVVLALRGTLSISGALIDMQGMDCKSLMWPLS